MEIQGDFHESSRRLLRVTDAEEVSMCNASERHLHSSGELRTGLLITCENHGISWPPRPPRHGPLVKHVAKRKAMEGSSRDHLDLDLL